MLQTAVPPAPVVPEPETERPRASGHHPRLLVQRAGTLAKRRHFARAVRRVTVLATMDATLLVTCEILLGVAREVQWLAAPTLLLFPPGFMGGWGSVAAVMMGLVLAGSYESEERWMAPGIVFRGVALGAALAMWQSIDGQGVVWTSARWLLVTALVGTAVAGARFVLGIAVVAYRSVAKPDDRVILVGDPQSELGRQATQVVAHRPGMESVGWLSERVDVSDYLGHPSAVWEVLCETGTDTVVLCDHLEPGLFDAVIEAAAVAGCRVLSVRTTATLMASQPKALNGGGFRMLELTFPASRAGQDVLKRAFDLTASIAILAVLSPLLTLIGLLIKLDSAGPVFFVQQRVGQAGRTFPMFKFRTMRVGADAEKGELEHLNRSGDPRLFKIPNDPRVTRVGQLLRRWSLDELPQVLNVVRGEMSLVGPRPFFEADLAAYDDHHFIRLAVKPGITGLWQVKGRSSIVDFEEVIALDNRYVEGWSFALDLKILALTLPAVFRRTGAY